MVDVDSEQAPSALGTALKERITRARRTSFPSVRGDEPLAPEPRGPAWLHAYSDQIDAIVRELWAEVAPADADLTLAATGGWGRREVAPYSDLDFVLLSRQPGQLDEVAQRILYPLWDAGLSVGHSVGSPRQVARLAQDDLATATAMLDSRWIAGARDLADELRRRTLAAVASPERANELVSRLSEEMDRRHRRFGASLYLLEPHLKQGTGALRDVDTVAWIARARYQCYHLDDLVGAGQLSRRQVSLVQEARGFLLELRALLQMAAGRRTDQLTFEAQELIAPLLFPRVPERQGDIKPAVAPAVEALMQRYYLHARGVVTVAERFIRAARVPKRKRPRIARVDASFLLFNGRVAVKEPAVLDERPAEMVRIFRVAAELDVPVYGHTKELIEERLAAGARLTGDQRASRLFLDALIDVADTRRPSLLEQMHQVGLLSELMPEFAPCTCRVQHDLYHVYTVDQHQLNAVNLLKRHLAGDEQDVLGQVPLAVAEVTRPEVLFLGTLLHDVGKPLGKGHADKGARLAGIIARRLGLSGDDVATVELLVRQHLTMAHVSQRRDLSDPGVIQRFADTVGTEERLAYLYLLSRCDSAMTAPGNLSEWKDQLLGELYQKARALLRGVSGDVQRPLGEQAERARARAVERVARRAGDGGDGSGADTESVRAFVDALDDSFVIQLSASQLLRQYRLARRRAREATPVAIAVAHFPLKGHSELAVVADDTPGLLADIAGALAASRVDILEAAIGTGLPEQPGNPPLALDLFHVRDIYGKAVPADDPRWDAIRADLAVLIDSDRSAQRAEALIHRRRGSGLRPRVTPGVQTSIVVDNDASADYSVVEIFTQDRPGVLHTITRTVAELGLDIHLAKIGTEGERVADAFYVADARAVADGGRAKLTAERAAELETALVAALGRWSEP